jgi:hypothetical protein
MCERFYSKSRASFLSAAAILCAAAIGMVIASTQLSSGAGVTPTGDAAPAPSFAAACAKADLELITAIEKYENTDLNATPVLVDAATLQQFARTTCAGGDVTDALAVYRTAVRQLDIIYAELERVGRILRAARPDR